MTIWKCHVILFATRLTQRNVLYFKVVYSSEQQPKENESEDEQNIEPVPLGQEGGREVGGISLEESRRLLQIKDKKDRERERKRIREEHKKKKKKQRVIQDDEEMVCVLLFFYFNAHFLSNFLANVVS